MKVPAPIGQFTKAVRNRARKAAGAFRAGVDQLQTAAKSEPDDVVLEGFERSLQWDTYSCGAQCAFMILQYFGKARSLEQTTKLLGTDEDGTGIRAIRGLFRARGLTTTSVTDGTKKDIERAIDADSPMLVSLDDDEHWACVYGYGTGRIYLADPIPLKAVVVDWSDFKRRWTGWGAAVSRARRRRNSR